MNRLLSGISLAALLALGGHSGAFPLHGGSSNASASCPFGTAYPDGCTSAQTSGIWQQPGFFTSYIAASGSGFVTLPHRPPWNVAGVDYPVGYAGTLADPSTATLPSGVTRSGSGSGPFSFNVTAGGVSLSGYDFSLHNGMCVTVSASSGTDTFSNDKFGWGTSCNPGGSGLVDVTGTASVQLFYDEFVGVTASGQGPVIQSLVQCDAASAVITVKYSAFLHAPQGNIQPQYACTIEAHYNYVEGIGQEDGSFGGHGDWIIGNNGSGTLTQNESFNTVFMKDNLLSGGPASSTSTTYITTKNGGGTITGYTQNNTMVGTINGQNGFLIRLDIGPGETVATYNVQSNYLYYPQSYGNFSNDQGGGTYSGVTCSGNVNMIDGTAATFSSGPFVCTP